MILKIKRNRVRPDWGKISIEPNAMYSEYCGNNEKDKEIYIFKPNIKQND